MEQTQESQAAGTQGQEPEAQTHVREPEAGGDDGLQEPELDPADFEPRPFELPRLKPVLTAAGLLLALLLALVLPPLLNVSRLRRQIATSISESLGRPVHMDKVTLNLLPIPGFTLENFVVGEDPSFGWEPVIHANSVRARLRMRSLWRRRVEFSRISLTDTSVNLVHRADGRWNIESILLRASRIEAAPTAQSSGGAAPRFPYIEASNARVNVKMGLEKMPIALTETDFALWLPQPQQWRLRLLGRPARTDNAATDTGTIRVQGTLGKAGAMAEVPVDLQGEWTGAPLGAVSWVVLGRDADFRGDMTLRAAVNGTVGSNTLSTRLELRGARRAEFVPARTLDVDVDCKAQAGGIFHRLESVQCVLPSDAVNGGVEITGSVPELLHPRSAVLAAQVHTVDAARLLDALRLASARISPALELSGRMDGRATLKPLQGSFTMAGMRLALGTPGNAANTVVDLATEPLPAEMSDGRLTVGPVALELGGAATLEGSADRAGYTMHLSGTVLRSRLLALAQALPQFGDGLEAALPPRAEAGAAKALPEVPMRVDLVSSRPWTGGQSWTAVAPRSLPPKRTRRR